MSRPAKSPIPIYEYDAVDRQMIKYELIERARLCDEDAIEAGYKALARIRRAMQLLRADRAVAKEREAAA